MPGNSPVSNDEISPELEVALVLLQKARQDLVAVGPAPAQIALDRKPAYELANQLLTWANEQINQALSGYLEINHNG